MESKPKLIFETLESDPDGNINACRETLNVKKILAEQESMDILNRIMFMIHYILKINLIGFLLM